MKHILVVGGGVAGLEASKMLSAMGYTVSLVEQSDTLGGKLNQWDRLFPECKPASELLNNLQSGIPSSVNKNLTTCLQQVQRNGPIFHVLLSNGVELDIDAILVTIGFDVFNASYKEEYGYGIYDNVITSAELEKLWKSGKKLKTSSGYKPKRIGVIHCVGSRDEKAGHTYCSNTCCITAVKQSIELTEEFPGVEVFCFYMDLRMFGRQYEHIYKKAQMDHGVQFIRGRLSETFENPDGTVMLKVEDTLLGKPLRMNVDIAVLMVGMVPSVTTTSLKSILGLDTADDGFFTTIDSNYDVVKTNIPGIFVAGACTGPKNIENTINEARAACMVIMEFFNNQPITK